MNSSLIARVNDPSLFSRGLGLWLSLCMVTTPILGIPAASKAHITVLQSQASPQPVQTPRNDQIPSPSENPGQQQSDGFQDLPPIDEPIDELVFSPVGEHIQADRAGSKPGTTKKESAVDIVEKSSQVDDDRNRAEDLFNRANQAYALAQYAKAIALFEEAWELSHEPTMLHNLGQAYWKRYNVEPDLDYLRQAKTLFSNYDKLMRANPDLDQTYNPNEIEGYVTAIQAQIQGVEQQLVADRRADAAAQAAAAAAVQRQGPTLKELQIRQRRRTTAALKGTGIGLIVLGSTSFLLMISGLATRGGTKFMLDQANRGGDRGVNLNSPKDENNQRHWYRKGGQIAFGALISTAIALPIGIGLQVTALLRQRKDRREEKFRTKEKISYGPNPLEIHF